MRRHLILSAFLPLALLVAISQAQSKTDKDLHGTFTRETNTRQATFDVPEMTKKVRLRLKMEVKSGKASWLLRDPNGAVRIQGEINGHLSADTGELKAITGAWMLEIKLDNATGTSQANWASY